VEFADPADYDRIEPEDELQIDDLVEAIKGADEVRIVEKSGRYDLVGRLILSERDREILQSAGLLNYTRKKVNG
jgi:aconitate hydratase